MKLIDSIEPNHMITIEWQMMDPAKYLPLSLVNAVAIRTILYPLTVIKTRMQVQTSNSVYRGTYDACFKIVQREGFPGLYKGFFVNTMQVGSGLAYILTYENVKYLLSSYGKIQDTSVRSLIAGGIGSIISQTIITPFDIVSQHMMVISGRKKGKNTNKFSAFANPLHLNKQEVEKYGIPYSIVRELRRKDGFRGYYRGYFASLAFYVPNSALWWYYYEKFSAIIHNSLPVETWQLLIRSCAAVLSGATVAVLTNPLDLIRANFQIQRLDSYSATVRKLWKDEHLGLFYKGLSPRITQSCLSSVFVSIGYETMKRLSLREEYEDKIKW
ncbi:solute carrier family 25 member 44 [Tetranychus urticae]|uniref:Mitochondrial carrier protein n=1 Tax=Tetranychus urticae TaxID=32264 RepID=T1KAY2_TETUR|nr:solute carrier family 25 member 44 [Tetranychus urticae]